MRKQKLQFFILLLVLVLVAFGYLYARHYSRSHEEVNTSPSFELIQEESESENDSGTTEDAE